MSRLGARVVERCREPARVCEERDRLTRPYATPPMARANALVAAWTGKAGHDVRTDAAGNLIGACRAPTRRPARCCSARISTPSATPARTTGRHLRLGMHTRLDDPSLAVDRG